MEKNKRRKRGGEEKGRKSHLPGISGHPPLHGQRIKIPLPVGRLAISAERAAIK